MPVVSGMLPDNLPPHFRCNTRLRRGHKILETWQEYVGNMPTTAGRMPALPLLTVDRSRDQETNRRRWARAE
jgi:hypothetical protein